MGEAQEGLGTQAEMYSMVLKFEMVILLSNNLSSPIPVIFHQYFVVIKSMIPHQ